MDWGSAAPLHPILTFPDLPKEVPTDDYVAKLMRNSVGSDLPRAAVDNCWLSEFSGVPIQHTLQAGATDVGLLGAKDISQRLLAQGFVLVRHNGSPGPLFTGELAGQDQAMPAAAPDFPTVAEQQGNHRQSVDCHRVRLLSLPQLTDAPVAPLAERQACRTESPGR